MTKNEGLNYLQSWLKFNFFRPFLSKSIFLSKRWKMLETALYSTAEYSLEYRKRRVLPRISLNLASGLRPSFVSYRSTGGRAGSSRMPFYVASAAPWHMPVTAYTPLHIYKTRMPVTQVTVVPTRRLHFLVVTGRSSPAADRSC